VLAVVFLAFAAYQLGLSRQPKIVIMSNSKQAAGHYLKTSARYQQIAASVMANTGGSSTKVTINVNTLEQKMKNRLPEIAKVSVSLPVIGSQPVFYLHPASPALVLNNGGKRYLVASSGKVLRQVKNIDNFSKLKVPVVSDQADNLQIVNGQVLSGSDVAFITTLVNQLGAAKVKIGKIVLPAAGREVNVSPNGAGYFVKFNLADSNRAKQQIGDFLAARGYLKSKNIKPDNYIDARIPGRIYYR
jgi:hypothetical protein